MEKNKRLIILAILIVVVFFVWARAFKGPSRRRARVLSEAPGLSLEKAIPDAFLPQAVLKRSRGKSAYTMWGRNPFILGRLGAAVASELSLDGIVWDEESPYAIINDEIVKVGDEIAGNKVIDIKVDSVTLSDGSREYELKLFKLWRKE